MVQSVQYYGRIQLTRQQATCTVAFAGADPTADGGKGVFVESYYQTMQFVGYSMATGQKLWGPIGGNQVALNYFEEWRYDGIVLTGTSTPLDTEEYFTAMI